MKSQNLVPTSDVWSNVWHENHEFINNMITIGKHVLKYEQNASNLRLFDNTYFNIVWKGINFICANTDQKGQMFFEPVTTQYDAILSFGWKTDHWNVNLYSTNKDVNILSIAKEFGGNGHDGACGFQCKELPFLKELQKNA